MIRKVMVPTISANVTDATLTAWYKQEGDNVAKDEPLLELTTEKATFEVDAPCNGVLRKQLATVKSVLPAGYILALVGPPNDALPKGVDAKNRKLIEKHRAADRTVGPTPAKPALTRERKSRVRATPAARRVAREHAIDLSEVATALGGSVVNEDAVRQYLTQQKDGSS